MVFNVNVSNALSHVSDNSTHFTPKSNEGIVSLLKNEMASNENGLKNHVFAYIKDKMSIRNVVLVVSALVFICYLLKRGRVSDPVNSSTPAAARDPIPPKNIASLPLEQRRNPCLLDLAGKGKIEFFSTLLNWQMGSGLTRKIGDKEETIHDVTVYSTDEEQNGPYQKLESIYPDLSDYTKICFAISSANYSLSEIHLITSESSEQLHIIIPHKPANNCLFGPDQVMDSSEWTDKRGMRYAYTTNPSQMMNGYVLFDPREHRLGHYFEGQYATLAQRPGYKIELSTPPKGYLTATYVKCEEVSAKRLTED